MVDLDLAYSTAGSMAAGVAARTVSPVELVANALARAEEVDGALNCFCSIWGDEAAEQAVEAAAAVSRGDVLGPLHGVPVAVKDTTPVAGHQTTLGSFTHEGWIPERSAYVVQALQRAGAIIIGNTTSPEFAYSLITDSPKWGITANPWDRSRTTGGSSGGSGAAVASGCVPLAEGSDMGGSVRIPAAWCGVVGLKPSLGRIPMNVLPGLFDNISHHGPLARCVDDARIFVDATQGPDDADILSIPHLPALGAPLGASVAGLRIAMSVDLNCWTVDPEIEAAVRAAAESLRSAGATVTETDLTLTPLDEAIWNDLWGIFMATYYGHLVEEFADRMDPEVLALIDHGHSLSAVQAKRIEIGRTDLWRRVAAVLADHDAIICPTMATAALPAARADQPTIRRPEAGRMFSPDMTAVFNLISPCPALSVPGGTHGDTMPIGVQVIGRRWRDDTVLTIGAAVEAGRADLVGRRPPL